MSTPENIKNKAYSAARQLVRNRLAESAGAAYEKLGPTEKMDIDRAVETKQAHIKKIALKLIPQIANQEKKRVDSFNSGSPLTNYGSPEKGEVHEALNDKFAKKIVAKKKDDPEKGAKSPHIQMHSTFGEEVALDSAVYKALLKKADKSDVDIVTLGEVYDRGMKVWTEDTNVSQQQYAFARVNSFINKGKTYFKEDNDLLPEKFGDEYHVLHINGNPATRYQFAGDAKKDMDYLRHTHPKVKLELKKVTTTIHEAKKMKGKDPCWKGWKMAGTKEKGGREVPNCVPEEVQLGEETETFKKGDRVYLRTNKFANSPHTGKVEHVTPTHVHIRTLGGTGLYKAPHSSVTKDIKQSYLHTAYGKQNEEVEIDGENTLELTQEEMNFFVESGVQFDLTEATIRNTKKLIQRLHDKEQGQTYGGGPYSRHPKAVMRLGIRVFGGKRFDQNARKAALLHDTIEDTPTSPETLLQRGFHPDVVKAVQLLSKDKTKSYEGNIDNIANGDTAAHRIAQHVKYADNMSNYLQEPKPEWDQERIKKQKGKYMDSMERLGRVLGVNAHTRLKPKWKMKTEEVDKNKPSNREYGTDILVKIYKKDTPGQNLDESFNMAFDYQGKPTLAPTAHELMMKTQGGFAHHNDVQDVMNVTSIKEQIEKAFQATILEEDKAELAISMDNLIDMVNEAFTTIANIKSSNIERDAWSQAQILKLERYIESVAAYINNLDETVRSGELKPVTQPAHTEISPKTGQSITIPGKVKNVKTGRIIVNKGDNPYDGK